MIYNLDEYKRWCVVHARTNRLAAEFVKKQFPGAEVTNVRGPVHEYNYYTYTYT